MYIFLLFVDYSKDVEQSSEKVELSITAIVSTTKGLAVACPPGLVHWFDHVEDTSSGNQGPGPNANHTRESYRLTRTIKIPVDPTSSSDVDQLNNQKITHLVVSPSEDVIVASTDAHQIYCCNLGTVDLGVKGHDFLRKAISSSTKAQQSQAEVVTFEPIAQAFHHGQILGMDTCIRKPLIATCAADRTVRIWNFETK